MTNETKQGAPPAQPKASHEKPAFHIMQRRESAVDPGHFIIATFRVDDEAGLYTALEQSAIRRNQVLVPANSEALSMLLALSCGSAEDAPKAPKEVSEKDLP